VQKKQPVDCSKQPIEIQQQSELPKEWRIPRDLSVENIIGQIKEGVSTRSSISNFCRHTAFVSQIEPKSIDEALKDEKWVEAMNEELNQFARNEVWFLVPKTAEMNIIGSKWVFKNKLDKDGMITRNKARLVVKGYNQEQGIDYGETFAPVARLEDVRLLLAFACMSGFKLFQMDVNSAFLNCYINEEVYVDQPPGFEDHQFPNHVFKLKKALYGLKQAPRQWYERLSNFLLSYGYERGMIDKTLFIKKSNSKIILVQIYVDDIIFGATQDSLCEEFVAAMKDSDFAGCKLDRKSTSGTCHLLGSSIISWHSKKQACVPLSTAEAEYIDAGSCCAQILWLKQQLADFGLQISKVPLMCDNTSAINLTKNQIQHSRTKHIEIRHHFIRDHVSMGDCEVKFIEKSYN